MIDLAQFGALIANILGAVAILAVVIFAVVAWLKQMGLRDKPLTIAAFVVGFALAMIIRYALVPASTFADWVWTALFGLMSALLATGAYKGVESATGAAVVKKQAPLIEAAYRDYPTITADDTAERQ